MNTDNSDIKTIALIGVGNVGSHLLELFLNAGVEITQVYSRNQQRIRELQQKLKGIQTPPFEVLSDLKDLKPADACILAIPDDAIGQVAGQIKFKGLLLHVSGSVPMSVLQKGSEHIGVFYLLQTFRRGFELKPQGRDFPICICAGQDADLIRLEKLALRLGHPCHHLDDSERLQLHLSAVFVNNFANHCFALAEDHLQKHALPFDLLMPLIRETAGRLEGNSAKALQTGPARRGDEKTINRHLKILGENTDSGKIYALLSKSIASMYADNS